MTDLQCEFWLNGERFVSPWRWVTGLDILEMGQSILTGPASAFIVQSLTGALQEYGHKDEVDLWAEQRFIAIDVGPTQAA